jgi:hypothetical protein
MAFDAHFIDGFDAYGDNGRTISLTSFISSVAAANGGPVGWTSAASSTGSALDFFVVDDSLVGPGLALRLRNGGGTSSFSVSRTLTGNFARCIGTMALKSDLVKSWGFQFLDGATAQLTMEVQKTGNYAVRRGGLTGIVLATSSEATAANSAHHLTWDIGFNGTTGYFEVYLDSVLMANLDLSSQDTTISANDFFNRFTILSEAQSGVSDLTIDHMDLWLYTAMGGGDAPPLTNPLVETQFPTSDNQTQWTFGAGVLGETELQDSTSIAGAANVLRLRKFTPEVDATLDSVSIIPAASSGTAKFKGVAYADSAGVPGSLLSSGTEVVACTANTRLNLNLVTPQALTAGTPVWIGYITDISVVIGRENSGTSGFSAANTYASGAPGTAPTMTASQPSFLIYGKVSGVSGDNWSSVNQNPGSGSLSFISSATVNNEDLYAFSALSSTPQTIYHVVVCGLLQRSDAGARTVDFRTKSSATTSSGADTGITPATTQAWNGSTFVADPNTGSPFLPANLNAALSGLLLAS